MEAQRAMCVLKSLLNAAVNMSCGNYVRFNTLLVCLTNNLYYNTEFVQQGNIVCSTERKYHCTSRSSVKQNTDKPKKNKEQ